MKEIVFNDKAIEFFKGEQKKTLDDIAVTVVHKDTLKNKNKVINDLLSKISDLEFEVERLDNIINKAIEILENADYWDNIGNELLPLLKGSDKE